MKKVFAFLLAVVLVVSMAPAAFAANATPGTTTLTTTVPDAEYVLNIPADQKVDYGETYKEIGNVTITNAQNFALGKNVEVTITYDAFKSEAVSSQIPFVLKYEDTSGTGGATKIASGSSLVFPGMKDGTVHETARGSFSSETQNYINQLCISMLSADWGKALAGDYAAKITFAAKVVVEE